MRKAAHAFCRLGAACGIVYSYSGPQAWRSGARKMSDSEESAVPTTSSKDIVDKKGNLI